MPGTPLVNTEQFKPTSVVVCEYTPYVPIDQKILNEATAKWKHLYQSEGGCDYFLPITYSFSAENRIGGHLTVVSDALADIRTLSEVDPMTWTFERKIQVLVSLNEALLKIHACGEVYGDLRPCNILLSGSARVFLNNFIFHRLSGNRSMHCPC